MVLATSRIRNHRQMARARSRNGQSAIDDVRAAYDEAPYESYAHPQSAPGQLAAIAWAFGLDPPDVARSRVLEIGCAAAGNLIPFAAMHPLARTVGVDLSRVHIDQGRRRVRALGLDNIELMHGDIAHLDLAAMGQFDFIICHGVYSRVPDEVQAAILAACGPAALPRRRGIRRLQHVSRLEGQGNRPRRDAPQRR